MSKPHLLDLFCGAGGAAMGYARAGFEVVGVDNRPQPHYPFEFVQYDALEFLECCSIGWGFSAIHASPPCQRWSVITGNRSERHPDLISPLRPLLKGNGVPYVIENVPGAPLIDPVMICGSSVGLRVRRHRLFEASFPLLVPRCAHGLQRSNPQRLRAGYEPADDCIVPVYGGGQSSFSVKRTREAMEIDWMTQDELSQAIPPAYTELIGHQLMQHLRVVA